MASVQLLLGSVTAVLFGIITTNIGGAGALAVLRPRDCSFSWPAEGGETCKSMASEWALTEDEFISYNLGVDCAALVAGQDYCVEWSGTPPALPSSVSTTTTKPTTTPSITTTSPTKSSKTTTTSTTTDGPVAPSPTQDGITKDCQQYHLAVSGDTCNKIVSSYGTFTLSEFYDWNPAVGNDCSGLWLGYYYCIAVSGTPTTPNSVPPATTTPASQHSPTQDGITEDCKEYHLVVSGDTCQKIVTEYGTFTLDEFYLWNPAVGTDCSGLWLSYYVCVGVTTITPTTTTTTPTTAAPTAGATPSPTQPGVTKNCIKWYLVVSGDFCQKIVNQFDITLANFYAWNPAVGNTCASLWLDYYVCVGI